MDTVLQMAARFSCESWGRHLWDSRLLELVVLSGWNEWPPSAIHAQLVHIYNQFLADVFIGCDLRISWCDSFDNHEAGQFNAILWALDNTQYCTLLRPA